MIPSKLREPTFKDEDQFYLGVNFTTLPFASIMYDSILQGQLSYCNVPRQNKMFFSLIRPLLKEVAIPMRACYSSEGILVHF